MLTLHSSGGTAEAASQSHVLDVELTVTGSTAIVNGGADDLWRMSRLSWLDSTLGIDRNTTSDGIKRFDGVQVAASAAATTATLSGGRSLTVSPSKGGAAVELFSAIAVGDQPVLASPIEFAVAGAQWKPGGAVAIMQQDNMTATLSSLSSDTSSGLSLNSTAVISYDGFVDVTLALRSRSKQTLNNATLSIELPAEASTFLMGFAKEGRNRSLIYPQGIRWEWAGNKGGENQVRRSMHQGCLLNPRNSVFYPFLPIFPHLSPIFSVWTPGIQGARPEVPGETGKNR